MKDQTNQQMPYPQSLADALAYARLVYPELAEMVAEIPPQGQQNHTLLFPDRAVRLPKASFVAENMAAEARILAAISQSNRNPYTSVATPRLIDYQPDNNIMTISRLPGDALSEQAVQAMDSTVQRDLGERLGRFAALMHGIATPDRPRMMQDASTVHTHLWHKIERHSNSLLSYAPRIARVRDYLENFDRLSDDVVTVHADIAPKNTLFCLRGGISVIDFSSTHTHYRHYDFAKMESAWPEAVMAGAYAAYESETGIAINRDLVQAAKDAHDIFFWTPGAEEKLTLAPAPR